MLYQYLSQNYVLGRGGKITFWFQFISACISKTALVPPTLPHHQHVCVSFFVTKPRLFWIHDLPRYVSLFFWTCHKLLIHCQNAIYLNGCATLSKSILVHNVIRIIFVWSVHCVCLDSHWKMKHTLWLIPVLWYFILYNLFYTIYFASFLSKWFLSGWSFKVVSYTVLNRTSFYFCWLLEIYLVE